MRSPTRPPARWTGGCFCPRSGTTTPSGAAGPTCPTASGTSRSGSWPWSCWTSWPAGAWCHRWCWPTPPTARSTGSGLAWSSASWPTSCRSPAPSAPTPRTWHPRRCRMRAAGAQTASAVAWREGADGQQLVSRFVALRVRPAGVRLRRATRGGELPVRWLLAEWPQGEPEPVKYWLANLDDDLPLVELVRLAKLRWRVEHDYRELKDALGLDHFEGRSFKGWHHHVTLVSVAHAFVTLERLDPKAPASA